jgi:hypothetical protein
VNTPQTDLFEFLYKLPLLDSMERRKATLIATDYPYVGLYLDYQASQEKFAQALIDAVTARGRSFTLDFFTSLVNEIDLGLAANNELSALLAELGNLDQATWRQTFPAKLRPQHDRTRLIPDPDMLAATVVSTVLRPYFELGPEQMDTGAAEVAGQVATEIEQSFAGQRVYLSLYAMFKRDPQANQADYLGIFRDVLDENPDLSKQLAERLMAEPEEAEAALQSMVKVAQTVKTVKGEVMGAIIAGDVLRGIGVDVDQNVGTVESGGTVVGAVIGNPGSEVNIGGEHRHGPTYEAGSQHADKIINAEGGVVATDGGVAAGSGGVAVGGDVSGSNIVTGSGNTITESHSETDLNTGGGAYVGGDVSVSGGDFIGRDSVQQGDTITANISGSSNVAVGKTIDQQITTTSGLSGDEIAKLFAPLIEAVASLPSAQQAQAQAVAADLIRETAKGEDADDSTVARTLRALGSLGPAAATAATAVLGSPVLAGFVGPFTQFVMEEWRK